MKPFHYTKLSDSANEIRLLRILPNHEHDRFDAPIKTKLYTFPLSLNFRGCPSFAAISYTRGTHPQPTVPIQVNGALLPVQSTVYELLLQLRASRTRFPRQPHFLWIDSVCINQEDGEERKNQARLTRGVYSTAEVVMVWLSTAQGASDEAMRFLAERRRGELGYAGERPSGQVQTEGMEDDSGGKRGVYCGSGDLASTVPRETREKVMELLRNEYWGRTRNIPEVLLARKVVVLCGAERVTWKKLEMFFATVEHDLARFPTLGSCWGAGITSTHAWRLVTARAYFEAGKLGKKGWQFMELWEVFGTSCCIDVRDMLFVLLGMSSDEVEDDWGENVLEVYDEVVAYVQNVYGADDVNLELLVRVLSTDSQPRTAKWKLAMEKLGHLLDRMTEHIVQEINSLSEDCNTVTMEVYDTMGRAIDNADAEIARFEGIMKRIDHLELEFDRIVQIRDVVRRLKFGTEVLDPSLGVSAVRH